MEFNLGTTWSHDISFIGLFKLLFKKKICKVCKSPLTLEKKKSSTHGIKDLSVGDYYYGNHHTYTYLYRCPKCPRLIKISEL